MTQAPGGRPHIRDGFARTECCPVTGDREVLLASFAKVHRLNGHLPGIAIAASHDFATEESVSLATGRPSPLKEE